MKEKKIYLDKAGYKQYLKRIEQLKQKLKDNSTKKSSSYNDAVGDGWHDNPEFEEAKRQELAIIAELERMYNGLNNIIIIDKTDEDETIDINDYVTVFIKSDGTSEEMSFKLVASYDPDLDAETPEITVNSPLGESVYQRGVGDNSEYSVNGRVFKVMILSKTKEVTEDVLDEEPQNVKKKSRRTKTHS